MITLTDLTRLDGPVPPWDELLLFLLVCFLALDNCVFKVLS